MHKELDVPYKNFVKIKEQFVQRLKENTIDQNSFKPSNGEWSNLEVFEHIQIAEDGILDFFKRFPPSASQYQVKWLDKLKDFGLSKLYKSAYKVKVPIKSLDPKGNKKLEDLIKESNQAANELQSILIEFPIEKLNYSVFKHPVAGGMSMKAVIKFWENHVLHHNHQLDRIAANKNYPSAVDRNI